MAQKTQQHKFSGKIPENYDRYIGPILMEPYGADMAKRLPAEGLSDVLELACGTGIVTRHLRERLGEDTKLVATDISEGMLEIAKKKPGMSKPVEWKAVDATSLPFKDNSFDAVVSQFGVMFFPDKEKAFKEIFRILRPGGKLLFSVWDKIEHNDFPHIAHTVLGEIFEGNPPEFYNTPFGYWDHYLVRTEMRQAGFVDVALTTVEIRVQAQARDAAVGFVEGNPIVNEIEALGKNVADATEAVEKAIMEELGKKVSKGKARAIVFGGKKPGVLNLSGRTKAPKPEAAVPKATTRKPAPKKTTVKTTAKPPSVRPKVAKAKPKARKKSTPKPA